MSTGLYIFLFDTKMLEFSSAILVALVTFPLVKLIEVWFNKRKVDAENRDIVTHASETAVRILHESIEKIEEELKETTLMKEECTKKLSDAINEMNKLIERNHYFTLRIEYLESEVERIKERSGYDNKLGF